MTRYFTILFLSACFFAACGSEGGNTDPKGPPSADTAAAKTNQNDPPPEPDGDTNPIEKKSPKRDTLSLEDFRGQFKYRKRQNAFVANASFCNEVEKLKYFNAVTVVLSPNLKSSLNLQNFYAVSLSENKEGNYELVTVEKNEFGCYVYLSTLMHNFIFVGSVELARFEMHSDKVIRKYGRFVAPDMYEYNYVQYDENGVLTDSLIGKLKVPVDGKFMFQGEDKLK